MFILIQYVQVTFLWLKKVNVLLKKKKAFIRAQVAHGAGA